MAGFTIRLKATESDGRSFVPRIVEWFDKNPDRKDCVTDGFGTIKRGTKEEIEKQVLATCRPDDAPLVPLVGGMTPEHKTFLDAHVAKMGYMFIVDVIEEHFKYSKADAIKIFDEYKAKHPNNEAQKQLSEIGAKVGAAAEKAVKAVLKSKKPKKHVAKKARKK